MPKGVFVMARLTSKTFKTPLFKRGGQLNQKLHVDMTDDEKANIQLCPGDKNHHPCKNPVFRCTECGNYGCSQVMPEKCSDQGFKNDRCLHCGSSNNLLPVMKDEFAKLIEEWEKNDK